MILLIEDRFIDRTVIENSLQEKFVNNDIYTATNKDEAMEKIEKNKNNLKLVILDIRLPKSSSPNDIDCWENSAEIALHLKTLEKNDKFQRIPVLLITAFQDACIQNVREKIGFPLRYFIKPFLMPEFIKVVEEMLPDKQRD
ncbi:MAG: hypothetical protein SV062_08515 [Thermodesulfobacteriota bacterium]|nr:hypothetical protein [Thermodesulfobacteriota bacterium]